MGLNILVGIAAARRIRSASAIDDAFAAALVAGIEPLGWWPLVQFLQEKIAFIGSGHVSFP